MGYLVAGLVIAAAVDLGVALFGSALNLFSYLIVEPIASKYKYGMSFWWLCIMLGALYAGLKLKEHNVENQNASDTPKLMDQLPNGDIIVSKDNGKTWKIKTN